MIATCRLCGSTALKLYYTEGNQAQFKYYKCVHCRLINYDLSAGFDQEKHTVGFVDPRDAGHTINMAARQSYRFIKKHVSPPGDILDVGCYNGSLLLLARTDGWRVHGLELFQSLADSVKETTGIDVTVSDFLQYDVEQAGSYDVVVLRHVLEHLPDSLRAMSKVNSLLREGGRAFLEFPNTANADMRLKWFLQRHGIRQKRFAADYVPHHCNEFCRKSFEYLLSKTGFKLQRWQTYSSRPWLSPFYGAVRFGNKARTVIRKVGLARVAETDRQPSGSCTTSQSG